MNRETRIKTPWQIRATQQPLPPLPCQRERPSRSKFILKGTAIFNALLPFTVWDPKLYISGVEVSASEKAPCLKYIICWQQLQQNWSRSRSICNTQGKLKYSGGIEATTTKLLHQRSQHLLFMLLWGLLTCKRAYHDLDRILSRVCVAQRQGVKTLICWVDVRHLSLLPSVSSTRKPCTDFIW